MQHAIHALCEQRIVRDDDEAGVEFAVQFQHQLVNGFGGGAIEIAGRLVE